MKITVLLQLVFAFFPPLIATGAPPAYGIRSGIITYDQTITLGKSTLVNRLVVSFDDYGMKECRETYRNDILEETFLNDGRKIYSIKRKTAYVMGSAKNRTELRYSWDQVPVQAKKDGSAHLLPDITVAGKQCGSYVVRNRSARSTYAGWAGILLFSEVASARTVTTLRAAHIEENVPVPAEKFRVPAGFRLQAFNGQ
ncbi:MAG TPA: hypothetical protein VMW43_03145 [Bacteroidota bacterium]|nr:hypothetical protein [Bacteroidota bacterium]